MENPSEYKYEDGRTKAVYGFEAFCKEIESAIMWKEWGRYEYEIAVAKPFETKLDKFRKIDCYEQCKNNIPIIAREVLYQYKNKKSEA